MASIFSLVRDIHSEVSEVLVLSLLSSEVLLGFSEVESEVLVLSLLHSEVLLGFSELESKVLVLGLLSIQLLLGFSELESEVLVLSLLSSEVESEVVSPGLLSLQLLLLSVQYLHGLIDGVSEGVKCLNLLLLNLPGLGLGLGEVTLQLGDTLFLSWRK